VIKLEFGTTALLFSLQFCRDDEHGNSLENYIVVVIVNSVVVLCDLYCCYFVCCCLISLLLLPRKNVQN